MLKSSNFLAAKDNYLELFPDILPIYPAALLYHKTFYPTWSAMASDPHLIAPLRALYEKWRSGMLTHVMTPLGIESFETLLPTRYEKLLGLLEDADLVDILEAAENLEDVNNGMSVGTTRQQAWPAISRSILDPDETEWLRKKVSSLAEMSPDEVDFKHLLLYAYFHKKLRMLR